MSCSLELFDGCRTCISQQLFAVHQSRRRTCVKALASFTSQILPYPFVQHSRSLLECTYAGDVIKICGRWFRFLVPFQAEEAEQIRKTPPNKQVAPFGFTGSPSLLTVASFLMRLQRPPSNPSHLSFQTEPQAPSRRFKVAGTMKINYEACAPCPPTVPNNA